MYHYLPIHYSLFELHKSPSLQGAHYMRRGGARTKSHHHLTRLDNDCMTEMRQRTAWGFRFDRDPL